MTRSSCTKHPYNEKYRIREDTRVLIVGTAPPPRFCKVPWSCEHVLDFDFFYGSGSNWMWGILPDALNEPNALPETLSAEHCKEKALQLLMRHKVWMRDVLERIKRKDGSPPNSARDSDIQPPADEDLTNFSDTIRTAPNLSAIATTSELAFKWMMQALRAERIWPTNGKAELNKWRQFMSGRVQPNTAKYWVEKHERPVLTLKPTFHSSDINCFILPSPSSRRAGLTLECKTQVYKRVLDLGGASIA